MELMLSDFVNRTTSLFGVLGLAPCHDHRKKLAGTSMSVPINITDDTLASSLVPVQCASLAPPAEWELEKLQKATVEVLHLFRCSTHTHPAKRGKQLRPGLWDENGDDQEMKMRWKWRWNESYLTGTQDGERKTERRNQERTQAPTHLARSGGTLKRQGKRKSGGRRKQTKTSGGGGGRTRLNKPNPAKTKPT